MTTEKIAGNTTPDIKLPLITERRSLLRNAGIGAAALGVTAIGMKPVPAQAQTGPTAADVLNFALNLEYLEAEFYLIAYRGHGLTKDEINGVGTLGKVTGGSKVPFSSSAVAAYAEEIAGDELNHVLFLRSALADSAVARPAINLVDSFNTLAVAAGLGKSFDPFASDENFLLGAYIFEDVGVTAYAGAAQYLTGNTTYLTAAASILAVEAYHAAEVRVQLAQLGLAKATKKISALRAALSGADDDQGVMYKGKVNIVPTDSNSLTYTRTPTQVLNIVYGGGSASNYLFYPNMMNGNIK